MLARQTLLMALLALSGCVTAEQRAAHAIAEYGPYCDRLGHQRSTAAWRDCVRTHDTKNRAYVPGTAPAVGEGGFFSPPF
jgi:hypothetical protein